MRARLIEDGGAAASDPEQFFRSPAFLEAEGATHTVAIEGDPELRLPVIVRSIEPGDRHDAISPYGYPGAAELPAAPPNPRAVDWSETGLVSIFVRDRIGEASLAGGTVRNQVHIADGDGGIRKRLQEQIRRNERRGWSVDISPAGHATADARAAFERAYAETMARAGAAERYLYPSEYFERLLRSERSWLLLAEREGVGEAGAIAVASDGYLHYYLGGTRGEALGDSPMKNLFAAMISLGSELGMPVNLGGGLSPGDSLDAFKRGFATGGAPFRTHEVICDLAAYEDLAAGFPSAPEGFFPAYRA
ncbi:MAG TPA: GNAT family N-acetyltransferase [Solirubrobacterales bacterium]